MAYIAGPRYSSNAIIATFLKLLNVSLRIRDNDVQGYAHDILLGNNLLVLLSIRFYKNHAAIENKHLC